MSNDSVQWMDMVDRLSSGWRMLYDAPRSTGVLLHKCGLWVEIDADLVMPTAEAAAVAAALEAGVAGDDSGLRLIEVASSLGKVIDAVLVSESA